MCHPTDYANNETYQQLPKESNYFEILDKCLYLDLRKSKRYTGEMEKLTPDGSANTLTTNKMRLKYWGYSQGENQHLLSPQGLTIRYKTYAFLPFSINIRNYFRLKNLTYSDDALISIKNFLFMVNSFTSQQSKSAVLPC